jgi:hopene-associated glycosyltransferase HpnB
VTFALAALLAWAYLVLFHGRFWRSGPELAPARPARIPPLAAIVPARDEAAVIDTAAASLAAQDVPLRIVVVDDGSADATAAIARRHGEVITGAPRPAGWAGKLWAVQQGIAATSEPWLLLTDADIAHDPRHLATLMAQAEQSGADLVSEMVALNCTSAAERMLVPAFVYFFQMLYPFARVNDPKSAVAAAAGGTMLVRRAALERIGGIAAIRGALIDDVALAAAIKRVGRVWLGHSALARSIRRYPRAADIWRMIARSAYVQLRYSPFLLVATLLGMALIFWTPPLAALFGAAAIRLLGAAAWIVMAASFVPTLHRYRLSPLRAPLLPLIATFFMAATLASALDHHRGRGVVWKRRAYERGA